MVEWLLACPAKGFFVPIEPESTDTAVRYLVDANALSEPAPNPDVVEWLRRNEREIAVGPIILGEDFCVPSFLSVAVGRLSEGPMPKVMGPLPTGDSQPV